MNHDVTRSDDYRTQNYLTVTFGSSSFTVDVFEPIVPIAKRNQVRVIAITRPDQPNVATTESTPRAAAQPANAPQTETPAVRPVRAIAIERPDRTETNGSGGFRREAMRDVASDAETDNETAPAGCNVAVCRQFYRSFDAPTCTYRSYQGTAKHCTR